MYIVSRTETFAKLFFIVSFTGLLAYVILAFYTFHTAYTDYTHLIRIQTKIQELPDPDLGVNGERYTDDLKYILLWAPKNETAQNMAEGQLEFIAHNCSYINCFITTNRELLNGDYKNFDAIVLDIEVLRKWKKMDLPQSRFEHQKYVFYSLESSDDSPICNPQADDYFNWTWSYKLYSDIFVPFFEVRDLKGNTIAPNLNVEWFNNATNLDISEQDKLKRKTKALAWIINRCGTKHDRMTLANKLYYNLKNLNLVFDIYGCGNKKCLKGSCLKTIERDYFFYLVFEDSITEDYVTKEVLKAYNNKAVPIIISGADLTKFLPPGSYIDGRFQTAEKLAAIIDYSLRNPAVYYSFHRWRKPYTFHEVEQLRGICQLCNFLNNRDSYRSHYETFRKWWFPGPLYERCYPKSAEKYAEVLSYVNSTVRLH